MSTVVVLGASDNPARISYQAIQRLLGQQYAVIPVNPKGGVILGHSVVKTLSAVATQVNTITPIDTITMYLGPDRQADVVDDILALKPRRVIFNPGAENPSIYARLQQAGIEVEEACTLVLLSTRQFDLPA